MKERTTSVAELTTLATDLDGTLIPLQGSSENEVDLRTLASQIERREIELVFATGRHFASVSRAVQEFQLPAPRWIVCDVGTSIYQRQPSGQFVPVDEYQTHLQEVISCLPILELRDRIGAMDGLRLQEQEKQGPFKLSYYADANQLGDLRVRVNALLADLGAPYSMIDSVDPFTGEGLIDLLPTSASKAYALNWWSEYTNRSAGEIVYAGDSGNDTAALVAGYHAIVVGNACSILARRVYDEHRRAGWPNRLFLAKNEATSGVLEGCRWFGLIPRKDELIRRLGATSVSLQESHFRVWAPRRESVAVEVDLGEPTTTCIGLESDGNGYFSGSLRQVGPGTRYRYVLDGEIPRPDPASRFQPDGVHGASQVVDDQSFAWTDHDWNGVAKRDLIIYELHVGSFSEEGTFLAAKDRIPWLVKLGITAVEIMPVAQSPGRWNWGYDGVNLFATRNSYGPPEEFKEFVNACHEAGLAVILDVVYNHLGPEGNYLADFGPYFSSKHHTPWGDAFNFASSHVRQFVMSNAIHWLDEYHLDGLRLDAVHFMLDDSEQHILRSIRQAIDDYSSTAKRQIHLIAEANVFDQELLTPNHGSQPYDAIWCDCLMHSIYAHAVPDLKLTRRHYRGAGDIATALQLGYVFRDKAHKRTANYSDNSGVDNHVSSFVMALQTHDSVGNHPHGKRLHHLTSKEFQMAAATLFLLYPSIPMIFMGEDVAAESPFTFFADFEDRGLRRAVDEGRAKEYPQHVWEGAVPPSHPDAYRGTKCHDDARHDLEVRAWYRELILLRKTGLADGWLSPEHMTCSHDAEHTLFSIDYRRPGEAAITAYVRLATPPSEQPVLIETTGEVILSSVNDRFSKNNRIYIRANQAIVVRQ